MTKTKVFSLLTASMLSVSCLGMTAFADTAYETGDVDMDGIITGHDAAMVSRYLLEEDYPLTEEQLSLADINGDGDVTQTDADEIFGMQAHELGKVVLDDSVSYRHLDDASEVCLYYARNGAGLETTLSDVQKNLADVNIDGAIDMQDVSMILGLFALRGAALIGADEVIDGVYYYSEDPASPAYIGDMYWTNIKDGIETL